jgi:AraC-like DNA-binding protein
MPAVLAVMATPEQPWTLETMAARAFLSRATFARHFAHQAFIAHQTQQPAGRLLLAKQHAQQQHQQRIAEATPEQPWTLETMAARAFLSRATFARHFARVYHLDKRGQNDGQRWPATERRGRPWFPASTAAPGLPSDTLLVLLLRMLLGEQQPPGGLLRLMSDERLMPAAARQAACAAAAPAAYRRGCAR